VADRVDISSPQKPGWTVKFDGAISTLAAKDRRFSLAVDRQHVQHARFPNAPNGTGLALSIPKFRRA